MSHRAGKKAAKKKKEPDEIKDLLEAKGQGYILIRLGSNSIIQKKAEKDPDDRVDTNLVPDAFVTKIVALAQIISAPPNAQQIQQQGKKAP